MKKGVFWLIDGELFAFPFDGTHPEGIAKSGDTYNHMRLWDSVKPKGCHKPFDHYPRGRVDVTNKGKAVMYISPHIGGNVLDEIRHMFEVGEDCIIRYDHSRHYECSQDRKE